MASTPQTCEHCHGTGSILVDDGDGLFDEVSCPDCGGWGSPIPKLFGDGIHDDTEALQWRIDHMGMQAVHDRITSRPFGTYRVSETLREKITLANDESPA